MGLFGGGPLAQIYAANCLLPNPSSIITEWFLTLYYWPNYLTAGMFLLTIFHYEYFYFLMTVVMLADWGINTAARNAFGPSNNIQPATCPIELEQMPALPAERIIVVYVVVWYIVTFLYPKTIQTYYIWVWSFAAVVALFTPLYLLFSTPEQAYVGAAIGAAEALCFVVLFEWVKYKGIDKLLIRSPKLFGFISLEDTMAYEDEPTIITTTRPKTIHIKTSQYSNVV